MELQKIKSVDYIIEIQEQYEKFEKSKKNVIDDGNILDLAMTAAHSLALLNLVLDHLPKLLNERKNHLELLGRVNDAIDNDCLDPLFHTTQKIKEAVAKCKNS